MLPWLSAVLRVLPSAGSPCSQGALCAAKGAALLQSAPGSAVKREGGGLSCRDYWCTTLAPVTRSMATIVATGMPDTRNEAGNDGVAEKVKRRYCCL